MTTFFGVMFILLMVMTTGAIEADNFMFGLIFALLGFTSGITAVYIQEKNKLEESAVKLYYKQKD